MSGITKRLRFWRQESTARFPETWGTATTGANAPPSYVSELVSGNVSNRDNRVHQRKMALMSAVGFNITVKLAQNAFDDWFEFVDETGRVIMQDVQQKLRDLNAQYYLTQALIIERIYGHSWIFVGREKLREDVITTTDRRVANLDCFGPENSEVVEFDEFGYPSVLEVTVLQGIGPNQTQEVKKRISRKDLILLRTISRPFDRSYEGLPILYPVWSNLVSVEKVMHSSDFYCEKVGHGFAAIITKGRLSDAEATELDTAMADASVTRVIRLNGNKVEKIEFINAAGSPVDFPAEIDSRLGIISAGTGVPKDLLVGLSAGAVTGSEVNVKSLYQTLSAIQTSCEPAVRDLVRSVGHTSDKYNIRWIVRFAYDQEQASKIKMNEAQSWAIKSQFLSVNEIRKELGYPPIEGGERLASEMKSELRVNVPGLQTAAEAEKTNNPQGANL